MSLGFPALICAGVLWCAHAGAQSIRFVGNGVRGADRVTVELGNGQPANVGATDFTIEFWLRAASGNNQSLPVNCNDSGYNWTTGNILLDRDRSPPNYRDFGLAIMEGRVVFGIEPTAGNSYTMCGTSDIRDDAWHHVVIQRQGSNGFLWMYIDGQLEQQVNGPDGDVSYDGGVDPPESQLVIGAEKFDFDTTAYPGFRGWIDELRISNRLQYMANFTPSATPFDCTDGAVALYHFDEGTGNAVGDACGDRSPGTRLFDGNPPGPEWSSETPFSSAPRPGQMQFTAATFQAAETAATLAVTVSRSNGTMGAATVEVDVNGGTATLNSDFSVSSTPLSWADGQQGNRAFTITLLNDAFGEGEETIELVLGNPTGATLGTRTSATVTITDDDQAPPPPPPSPPPGVQGGGGGGEIGWLWLLAGWCTVVLRLRCRSPLHPPESHSSRTP